MNEITTVFGSDGCEFREYLLTNPNTFIYSEPRFLQLLADHLSARYGWLVARKDKDIVGLLPFLIKDGSLGPVFNSLAYYGSNGGVVQRVEDINSKTALIETFYRIASEAKALSATIISNPSNAILRFTISIQCMIFAMNELV